MPSDTSLDRSAGTFIKGRLKLATLEGPCPPLPALLLSCRELSDEPNTSEYGKTSLSGRILSLASFYCHSARLVIEAEAIGGSSQARLLKMGASRRGLVMKTVKDILQTKGHDVWSITPDATVYEALKLMADKNVGALVVLDRETVVGIVSERDYARKVILHGRSSTEIHVREIMTSRVYYVQPEQNISECMAQMTDKHVRHLPALEHDRLVGVISIGDVVKAIIADHESTIKHLEDYITGGR